MDKNGLGEYLTMNFRHFLLSCNQFWWSGNFLDSIGQSRSLCCVYKLGVGGLNKILGSWLRQIFYSFTFLPHLVNNIKVRHSEIATKESPKNAGLKFGRFSQTFVAFSKYLIFKLIFQDLLKKSKSRSQIKRFVF